jgi:EmrB/QacA subfamily drug resistance transporter
MSGGRAPGWTLAITCSAAFMGSVDLLAVTTALPQIGKDTGASFTNLEWVINAYALAVAVGLFTGGALGERFGRMKTFNVGVAVFTIASVAAALAPNAETLIAARAVQGIGTAIAVPVTLTLILAAFPPQRLGMALGAWGGIVGTGVGTGPLIGGAVTDAFGWQSIFWINVPLGIVTVLLAIRFMTESRGERQPLDLVGLLLISVGLLATVRAVQGAEKAGWREATTLTQLALGAVLVLAFVAWEKKASEPMLPLSLLRMPSFAAANASGFLMGAALFSAGVLITQYFQLGRGYSPTESGLGLLPWTATPILISPLAGKIAESIGNRPLITAGLALQGVGLGWFGLVAGSHTTYLVLMAPLFVAGVGISLVFPTVAAATLEAAGPARVGVASSTANASRQVGGAIGIAAIGAVFLAAGGFESVHAIVDGLGPALTVAAAVSVLGAVTGLGVRQSALPARTDVGNADTAVAAGRTEARW